MIKELFTKTKEIVSAHVWLLLLGIILLVISAVTLKPEFYLMGFDNYSSYFNQTDVLWRTLFSAWRNHWGLGVPADSEMVDLPRQLFYLVTSVFLSKQLVDQLYVLGTLIFGALGMYFLGKLLYHHLIFPYSKKEWGGVFGFIAAFFYIFNLNTLGMYYFIIITYNSRFFAIPWLFYIFFSILFNKKISLKKYVLFVLIILASSGSYITGTILLTSGMTLGIVALNYLQKKTFKPIFTFFLLLACINAFWLPNFLNYTLNKSSIIRLAPTFIDANEAQLNLEKSWYNFGNQIALTPNFLELSVVNNEGTTYPWHPLAEQITQTPYNILFWIFPILYIAGALLIILKVKKHYYLLWIPVVILLFVMLSLKEYSPVGFIYAFLDEKIPLFGVLFRFGDTKFHPYIGFAGSLAAAFAIVEGIRVVKNHNLQWSVLLSFVTTIIVLNIFLFQYYFTGNLIGYFLYNKIPQAYFDIAKTINADTDENRVLHLPIEKDGYWKIYSWGYTGSSFFHYLIDKPFIDRTFEPASMENAYLHKKLYNLTANMQSLVAQGAASEKLNELYNVLTSTNTEYILFDETVGAEQVSRGLIFWGEYHSLDVQQALEKLEEEGLLEVVERHTVRPSDYVEAYNDFNYPPRAEADIDEITQDVVLYKVKNPNPRISFVEQASYLDSDFDSVLNSSVVSQNSHVIQNSDIEGSIYPFQNPSQPVSFDENGITINYSHEFEPGKSYTVYSKSEAFVQDRVMVEVTISRNSEQDIELGIYRIDGPQLGDISFKTLLETVEIPNEDIEEGEWKVALDGIVFTPPALISVNESFLGRAIINTGEINLQLLQRDFVASIDPGLLRFTENPNCFNDKLSGYQYAVKKEGNSVVLDSLNGSACLWRGLTDIVGNSIEETQFFIVNVDLEGTQQNIDSQFDHELNDLAKPQLYNYVQEQAKPNLVLICVKEVSIDECMNSEELYTVDGRQQIAVPLGKTIEGTYDPAIVFTLSNNTYQKQQLKIHAMEVESYTSTEDIPITVSSSPKTVGSFVVEGNATLKLPLSIPKAASAYSFEKSENDGFFASNSPCEGAYRTFRKIEGTWLSYISNCHNEMFRTLPFNSNNFYLWGIEYNLFAGKFPAFILEDELYEYKDEYTSLYTGYPDIEGFKLFQRPEKNGSNINYKDQFAQLPYKTAYTFINSQPDLADSKPKQFTLHQDSTNEAGFLLKSFRVAELPTAWENLVIEPENSTTAYVKPQSYSFKKILPSLWEVTIEKQQKGDMLLVFGEGYDKQWSIKGAKSHGRCNGFANCFELGDELFTNGTAKLYIYYWPQTLSYIGWGITMLGIAGVYFLLRSNYRH